MRTENLALGRVYVVVGAWYLTAHMRYPNRWPDDVPPQMIIQEALAGETEACALVQAMGERLGQGIAVLVDTLNPDLIVVGTLGVVLGELLLDPARASMVENAIPTSANHCRIVPAELGNALGDVAALMAAISAKDNAAHVKSEDGGLANTIRASLEVHERISRRLISEIEASGKAIVDVLASGHKVVIFGNGGSAAQAQHFAGELVGRYRLDRQSLPAIALSSDGSILTCIGNDYDFNETFSRQIRAFIQQGDVAIGLTTSGASANVLRALETAAELGATTIGLTGEKGLERIQPDMLLRVPSANTARIQEGHLLIIHAWCDLIDQGFASATYNPQELIM